MKNEINDLVTIYITSHNRPEYLSQAVNSVLNQSYKNFEIIIVDDASTNFDIYKLAIANKWPEKVKTHRNTSNKGANFCRNFALSKAQGKYITGLDDDDFFHHKRIEILKERYEKLNVSAVSTLSSYFKLNYSPSFKSSLKLKLKEILYRNKTVSLSDMKLTNYLNNQVFTEVYKLRDIGGFDNSFPSLQDYDAWFRLVKKFGPAIRISKVLYYYREHEKSITSRSRKKLEGHDFFLKKHAHDFDLKDKKSFLLNKDLRKKGKVSLFKLLTSINAQNYKRVFYLVIFKSYIFNR